MLLSKPVASQRAGQSTGGGDVRFGFVNRLNGEARRGRTAEVALRCGERNICKVGLPRKRRS